MAISLRKSINDKCRDCIYDPECGGGTWREQVACCPVTACPLWPIRAMPGDLKGPTRAAYTDPATLPKGFTRLSAGEAMARLRQDYMRRPR